MKRFDIEQIAIFPADPAKAIALLTDMGMAEWARDHVCAVGQVFGRAAENEADLAFNYEGLDRARELEVLSYTCGDNWMRSMHTSRVSHFGMHCNEEELAYWHEFFSDRGIAVAQEVETTSHTNPVIAGKRRYRYVIFSTWSVLGVDIKLIVRLAP